MSGPSRGRSHLELTVDVPLHLQTQKEALPAPTRVFLDLLTLDTSVRTTNKTVARSQGPPLVENNSGELRLAAGTPA